MPALYSSSSRFVGDPRFFTSPAPEKTHLSSTAVLRLPAEDGSVPFCEALASWYVAGVYDDTRGALKSTLAFRLHELGVEDVQALMCALGDSSYVVLMGPANGPRLLLPREDAGSLSEVRVVLPGASPSPGADCLVMGTGSNPYRVLKDAAAALAEATGMSDDEVHDYVLPLLDCVNRMQHDAAVTGSKSLYSAATGTGAVAPKGKTGADKAPSGPLSGQRSLGGSSTGPASSFATAVAPAEAAASGAWEALQVQQLVGSITVQAGPGCPAKPLLQSPVLRTAEGVPTPLGLRFSGLSMVYGFASDAVLSVMDSASAMRMVPRAANVGSAVPLSRCASASAVPTPAEGSASTQRCPTATSATLPSLSSVGSGPVAGDAGGSNGGSTAAASATPPLAGAGRSIGASPIVYVVAAVPGTCGCHVPCGDSDADADVGADDQMPFATPTGADASVLASLAVLGVRASAASPGSGGGAASSGSGGGSGSMSIGAVRACRIMPAAALKAAAGRADGTVAATVGSSDDEDAAALVLDGDVAGAAAAVRRPVGRLGLAVEVDVELPAAAAGSLVVFCEAKAAGAGGAGQRRQPVRRVEVDMEGARGGVARWSYDEVDGMLRVELPRPSAAALAPSAGACARTIRIYL